MIKFENSKFWMESVKYGIQGFRTHETWQITGEQELSF